MAIDIIARGLAASLLGSDGKISSDKLPVLEGTDKLTGFTPLGHLTDPSKLEGKTAEEVLIMMLYGVVNPTFTNPKLSISLSNNDPLIIGRQTNVSGKLTFNRGKINPAYGTSGLRAGAPISYSIGDEVIETNSTTCNFSFAMTPTQTSTVVSYSVNYSEGEQPLNSAGEKYDSPLPAGQIKGTTTIAATYAFYNSNGEDLDFTWFEDSDGKGYLSTFGFETEGNRQSFAVSNALTVVGVKAFDTTTQKWTWLGGDTAEVSLTYFDTTMIEGESLGEKVNYTLYTHNHLFVGTRELRVYVK